MDFHLSKEQEMIRKMYREFAETEVKPLAEELDEEERFSTVSMGKRSPSPRSWTRRSASPWRPWRRWPSWA